MSAIQNSLFILFLTCCFLIPTQESHAQSYGASLGLRLGNSAYSRTVGLTGQYRIARFVTLEGIIQSDFKYNTTAHLMLERHRRILTKRLNFYVGSGLSIGEEQSEMKNPDTQTITYTYGNPTLGVDLLFGAETTLLGYNVSIDYKPNFKITGRTPWYSGQVGVSLRQVVIKGAEQNKRQRQRAKAKRKKEREKEREERQEEPWLGDWFQRTFKKDK